MLCCDIDRSTEGVQTVEAEFPDPEQIGDPLPVSVDLCPSCLHAIHSEGLVAGLASRLDKVRHPRAKRNRESA